MKFEKRMGTQITYWLFWRPSCFTSILQNLFIFKLGWEVYGSHQCIKFGRKWLINDQIRVSTSGNQQTAAMVAAILVIVHQKKIFAHEQ